MTLDELVEDLRSPGKPEHHLRQRYADPMTGSADWGEVRLPGGQLVGVYSLSNVAPLKVAGFALRDKALADRAQYSEWIFRSGLPGANPVLGAGAGYSAPGLPPQNTRLPPRRP